MSWPKLGNWKYLLQTAIHICRFLRMPKRRIYIYNDIWIRPFVLCEQNENGIHPDSFLLCIAIYNHAILPYTYCTTALPHRGTAILGPSVYRPRLYQPPRLRPLRIFFYLLHQWLSWWSRNDDVQNFIDLTVHTTMLPPPVDCVFISKVQI